MRYHIRSYGADKVFYLPENELTLTIIGVKSLDVIQEVPLERPSYYKKMPVDFYTNVNHKGDLSKLAKKIEEWATEYSAITNVAVDGDYLVVQVRTCKEDLKKFALLFYDIKHNFKLKKEVFLDDYLMGYLNGKFYCFANGNPGRDEDTDECIINIYSLK
jgi:hypothetical protein